jgi:hypothetical protein
MRFAGRAEAVDKGRLGPAGKRFVVVVAVVR